MEIITFDIDFADVFTTVEIIQGVTATATDPLGTDVTNIIVENTDFTDTKAYVSLQNGTSGIKYTILISVTTDQSNVYEESVILDIYSVYNLLDDLRIRLRLLGSNLFDNEIQSLIDAAKLDMIQAGVKTTKVNDETDALITSCITDYVKANFGYDKDHAERLSNVYQIKLRKLTILTDYKA